MIQLILAIASSALVSIMMRLGEAKCSSKMALLVSNYTVCSVLGGFFAIQSGIPETGEGLSFAVILGIFGGFLFLYSLVVFQKSISRNGVILSSTFMKLGVLVPTLLAMIVFREQPKTVQLAGLALAVCAIILMNYEKGHQAASGKGLLLLLLLVCGGTDALTNVYDKLGAEGWKDLFLLVIFFTALVFSAVLLMREGRKPTATDFLVGIGVGIPNYFSSRFLLGALKTVSAVVVFPVYSTSALLMITLAGVLLFRETLDKKKASALALILAALVLLNM